MALAQLIRFQPGQHGLCTGMYKKGTGDDKQGKDVGNEKLCPYRNFSQTIRVNTT